MGDEKLSPNKYDVLRNRGIVLLICIPTANGKCELDFTISLNQTISALSALGIPVIINKSNNSCFVDLSRNLFVTEFMKSKCTHMLQIDSDMVWEADVVLDMLVYDKEFIAGIGRKKVNNEEYAGINYTDSCGTVLGQLGKTQEEVLIKMQYIGGAFTLHKKSVFERLAKRHPELRSDGCGEGGYYFYHCQYNKKAWHSEDYVFCHLCTRAGIEIWCYPNIDMGHIGRFNYKGNFFKYLKKQPPVKKVVRELKDILDKMRMAI